MTCVYYSGKIELAAIKREKEFFLAGEHDTFSYCTSICSLTVIPDVCTPVDALSVLQCLTTISRRSEFLGIYSEMRTSKIPVLSVLPGVGGGSKRETPAIQSRAAF